MKYEYGLQWIFIISISFSHHPHITLISKSTSRLYYFELIFHRAANRYNFYRWYCFFLFTLWEPGLLQTCWHIYIYRTNFKHRFIQYCLTHQHVPTSDAFIYQRFCNNGGTHSMKTKKQSCSSKCIPTVCMWVCVCVCECGRDWARFNDKSTVLRL